jgi:predicted tellurium resistance membrane protein TerC
MSNKQNALNPIFNKENYLLMAVGGIIIIIGIFLMAGGKSADPTIFDKNQVYSSTRITVAPILILLGLCVEIFAIFKKSKNS